MSGKIIYGIDLGTTYSAVAYVNQQGEPVCVHLGERGEWTIPSAVLFVPGKKVYVGEDALANRWIEGSLLVEFAKRDIGLQNQRTWTYEGWTYQPEDILALILRKLKQQLAKERGAEPMQDVVISHPQCFYVNQKEGTRLAGELARLNVEATISEPNAAAIAYGMYERAKGGAQDITVLVFDLGGGTFDVTLMKIGAKNINMLGSDGIPELGGIDWDAEIEQMAKQQFQSAAGVDFDSVASPEETDGLRKLAQKVKEELSRQDVYRFRVEAGGDMKWITITRAEFETMTSFLVRRCLDRCERLFHKTGYSWQQVNQVLMVGSSTKMPAIQAEVARVSGLPLVIDKDPKLMVAKGAAIWGHWIKHTVIDPRWVETPEGEEPSDLEVHEDLRITGRTAHSLGVLAKRDGQEIVRWLIQQNTPTPSFNEETFYTTRDRATTIRVALLEGESDEPSACQSIGQVTIDVPEPRPIHSPVNVKLNIDVAGRLEVQVTDVKSGANKTMMIERELLKRDADAGGGVDERLRRLDELTIL